MGFDLKTAKPAGGFDLSTARPIQEPLPTDAKSGMRGALETAGALATGSVASPIAGYAGIAGAVLPGPKGQGADWAERTQRALTYQPKTQMGQALTDFLSYPFEQFAKGADWVGGKVTDVTGSPALGATANTAINAAPMLLAHKGGKDRTPAAAPEIDAAAAARAREALNKAGIDWRTLPGEVRQRITTLAKDATAFNATSPQELARLARAKALPSPIDLTRGQAKRDPAALRAEENLAQTDSGALIRERQIAQNRGLLENLDILKGRTGIKSQSPEEVGQRIAGSKGERTATEGALSMSARKANERVNALYDRARALGEMDGTVDLAPLVEYLRTHDNPTTVSFISQKLRALKLVDSDEFGNLRPTHGITLNQLEGIRRAATKVAGTSSDGTARFYAGQAVREIDRMVPDSAGGQAYRSARAARRDYAMKFEEPESVSKLIEDKTRTDRRVALENVWDNVVLKGSTADLERVRNTLLDASDRAARDAGRKAWKDIAGQTVEYIKQEATKSVALDASGQANISPAGLKRALDRIGDKKLNMILGKSGADQLRNIANVAYDVKTLPPYKGGSTTVPNLMSTMDKILGNVEMVPFVGPVTGGAVRLTRAAVKSGKAGKEVDAALRTPLAGPMTNQPLTLKDLLGRQKIDPLVPLTGISLSAQEGSSEWERLARER